jgi:hypothetical protein
MWFSRFASFTTQSLFDRHSHNPVGVMSLLAAREMVSTQLFGREG